MDNYPRVLTDPAYRAGVIVDAMQRRGLPTDLRAPAINAAFAIAAETARFANNIVNEVALCQPHPLRYFAAMLDAWTRFCDELAEYAEGVIAGGVVGDLDAELGRLSR